VNPGLIGELVDK
jgi:hypothetical protein